MSEAPATAPKPKKSVVGRMQTRDELYDVLDYHAYERKLDELFAARAAAGAGAPRAAAAAKPSGNHRRKTARTKRKKA